MGQQEICVSSKTTVARGKCLSFGFALRLISLSRPWRAESDTTAGQSEAGGFSGAFACDSPTRLLRSARPPLQLPSAHLSEAPANASRDVSCEREISDTTNVSTRWQATSDTSPTDTWRFHQGKRATVASLRGFQQSRNVAARFHVAVSRLRRSKVSSGFRGFIGGRSNGHPYRIGKNPPRATIPRYNPITSSIDTYNEDEDVSLRLSRLDGRTERDETVAEFPCCLQNLETLQSLEF